MMKAKSCECSGKSKCIVITIETCCKKSAHEKKSHDKMKGTPSEKSIKEVASEPLVTEKSSSIISVNKDLAKKSSSKVSILEEPSTPEEPSIHEEPPEPKTTESKHVYQRVFKLPLVTERHHGAGCAMEISVLEKHEDSCIYKKEEVEGRNPIDDKSGSYDCIGRMVFRTCNSTETESDSDKSTFHGGSTGEKPILAVLPPKEEKVISSRGNASESSLTNSKNRKSSINKNDKTLKNKKSKTEFNEKALDQTGEKSIVSAQKETSLKGDVVEPSLTNGKHHKSSLYQNQKLLNSQKSITEVDEEVVRTKTVTTTELMPPRKDSNRKHYYGDGCKLNHRRDPYFPLKQHLDEGSITSKGSASIALQTEKISVLFSTEDVISMTDVSKADEKRKPSFLGAIFRTKR